MKEIYWKKLNVFQKMIFCFGWTCVLNLAFWIALLIHNSITDEDKIWNPKSYRVVYVFGWLVFISIIITLFSIIGFF